MGFNKRIVDQKTILKTKPEDIQKLFKADALIFMDAWASNFYEQYQRGKDKKTILKELNNAD